MGQGHAPSAGMPYPSGRTPSPIPAGSGAGTGGASSPGERRAGAGRLPSAGALCTVPQPGTAIVPTTPGSHEGPGPPQPLPGMRHGCRTGSRCRPGSPGAAAGDGGVRGDGRAPAVPSGKKGETVSGGWRGPGLRDRGSPAGTGGGSEPRCPGTVAPPPAPEPAGLRLGKGPPVLGSPGPAGCRCPPSARLGGMRRAPARSPAGCSLSRCPAARPSPPPPVPAPPRCKVPLPAAPPPLVPDSPWRGRAPAAC